jgi:DHA2 family multidrug resistance protein
MAEQYYDKGKLLLLNVALGLGTFIQVLDSSIANVAVPYIAGSLAVSSDEGTWVITSFAASNAVMLPLTGWLSDYFGRVRLFVWSVLLFAFTSFLCGFSTSLTMLIIFRVLQGAVAGSLIPLSQSLLLDSNPPEKKGTALGFWSMIVVVAPVLGPIVGGYLTDVYSWPWIFYINVPIGLFSAAVTWIFLKNRESAIQRNPIDWTGLTLLTIGVASLQIMFDKGKDLDWYESNVITALTIIAVIAIAYFIVWNFRTPYPIVDLTFLADRNFLFGTICITMGFLLYFCGTVILPLWLQTVQGYTAFWSGVAVAPVGVIPVIMSIPIGKNLHRFDLRYLISLSFLAFAISFFYQSNFTTEISLLDIMFARLIQGIGISLFFIPLVQLSLGNIPKARYASASGLYHFMRILIGSGFGTSLTVALWARLAIFHHGRIAEGITAYNPQIKQFYRQLDGIFKHDVSTVIINQVTDQQAYMLATNDVSWLAAWIFIAMIPIPFLCRRVKSEKHAGASGAH